MLWSTILQKCRKTARRTLHVDSSLILFFGVWQTLLFRHEQVSELMGQRPSAGDGANPGRFGAAVNGTVGKSSSALDLGGLSPASVSTATGRDGASYAMSTPMATSMACSTSGTTTSDTVRTARPSETRSPRTHMRHSSESALPSAAIAAAAAAALRTEPMEMDSGNRSEWAQGIRGRHRPPSR